MRAPELLVDDRVEGAERVRSGEVGAEGHADGTLHQAADGAPEPGRDVDPVRDGVDVVARQVAPGRTCRLGMEPAHRVRAGRVAQDEGGHVERRARVVGVTAAEVEQLTGLHAGAGEPPLEGIAHQAPLEDLVAGRHGRVNGEDGVAPDPPEGLAGREAGVGRHQLPGSLDEEERGVALVEVPDGGLDAERPEGTDAANPQDQLLAEPHLAAADIEDVRDRPISDVVGRDVGVEQEDRHAADLGNPDGSAHGAIGDLDADLERRAIASAGPPEGQQRRIEVRLGVLLVAIGVDLLAEVATPVEEADADEREGRVRRRLAVVARQDAEAARIELHRLVDPEFGAEVGNRSRERSARIAAVPRVGAVGEVAVELVEHAAGVDHEVLVGDELRPPRLVDAAQDADRVAASRPAGRVDAAEERLRPRRPAPPQVVGQLAETLEPGGKIEVVAGQGRHAEGCGHGGR